YCRVPYDAGISERHHHSMIVSPDALGFIYPVLENGDRILEIPAGTVISSCPGDSNAHSLNAEATAEITCRSGKLYYGKNAITWSLLGCRNKPRPHIERGITTCGSPKRGRDYTIVWQISKNIIIPQVIICFDEEMETPLFTHHEIQGRNIDAKIIESSRPTFKKAGLCSIKVNAVYSKRNQRALLTRILGHSEHISGEGEHYLARGHLSPDSDFILEPEQDATYYYANVLPQWQAVNNGNWKSLENSVRDLALKRRTTLEIWTGGLSTLQLPDIRDNPVDLFLGFTENEKLIPVPALIWKVIYDPESREGIAIMQVNDVGGSGTAEDMNLYASPCEDICSQISWVDWEVNDNTSGQTFCCTVQDFRRLTANAPNLKNARVLKS
ncbi:hypothetical protein SK128_018972, partial [Halocaridina rubra]